ncbi:MAG: MBL fold metallo-hydrolase [Gammaproteobacteria bacterium]|nr:MBL fold metallo-hydrolase [Gammaproteobacteria bacterium]
MRFASIGSGSRGNGTVIQWQDTTLLVDCGFSAREVETRLASLQLTPADIDAILVTHEHGDHVSGVGVLARKHDIPVWMTVGTSLQFNGGTLPSLQHFSGHESFAIRDIEIVPYTVPHDAREPCQFVFRNGVHSLALLTDVGNITPHIVEMVDGVDGFLLECNHDLQMLQNGPYPTSLKQRVAGRLGHLSNDQAAELLMRMDHSRLQHLVAMHLSDQNNQADLVSHCMAQALDCESHWIGIADQETGFSWRELNK